MKELSILDMLLTTGVGAAAGAAALARLGRTNTPRDLAGLLVAAAGGVLALVGGARTRAVAYGMAAAGAGLAAKVWFGELDRRLAPGRPTVTTAVPGAGA